MAITLNTHRTVTEPHRAPLVAPLWLVRTVRTVPLRLRSGACINWAVGRNCAEIGELVS